MLRHLLSYGGDPRSYIIDLLLSLPIILLSLSLHEAAHGYVAYKLGDPTARNFGRLTLNPAKHLDPIGFLCMLLAGIGWAKPVPVNSRNFKKPKRDMALTSAAGPISNLLLAVIFTGLLRLFFALLPYMTLINDKNAMIIYCIYLLLYYGISLNLTLAVFNLLPIPSFDGSRLLFLFLPSKYYFSIMKYERYISLIFMVLLFLGVLSPVISFVRGGLMNLLFMAFGF